MCLQLQLAQHEDSRDQVDNVAILSMSETEVEDRLDSVRQPLHCYVTVEPLELSDPTHGCNQDGLKILGWSYVTSNQKAQVGQ